MEREFQIPQVDPATRASKFVYAVEVTVQEDHPDALPTSNQVEDLVRAGLEWANAAVAHMTVAPGWNVTVRVTNEPNIDAVS